MSDEKPQWVVEKVRFVIAELLQANLDRAEKEVSVACFGLAFKPDIDDLRESSALEIVKEIAKIHAGSTLDVEPNITKLPQTIDQDISLVGIEQAIEIADTLVFLVDHNEFKNITPDNSYNIDAKDIW